MPSKVGGMVKARDQDQGADKPPDHISRYAKVTRLATDRTADEKATEAKLDKVGPGLLQRIQKMLKLAQHPDTSEAEAQQALRASARMLSAFNLTEAEVMAQESEEEQAKRAGHSNVTVRHRDGLQVAKEMWSIMVSHAICVAFNVKFFYTKWTHRIEFTFYGLCDNTVAAAFSFETVFNLALTWAVTRKDLKGRTSKNSYLMGFGDTLYRFAKKEKEQEEQRAIEAETRREIEDRTLAQQADMAKEERLAGPTATSDSKMTTSEDVEDDDDVVFVKLKEGKHTGEADAIRVKQEAVVSDDEDSGPTLQLSQDGIDEDQEEIGDQEEERKRFDEAYASQPSAESADGPHSRVKSEPRTKPEPTLPGPKKEELEDDEPMWQSHGQLIRFKETAAKVAEEYGKTFNIRQGKAQSYRAQHDATAYAKGKEDARKVDLKRKRLE